LPAVAIKPAAIIVMVEKEYLSVIRIAQQAKDFRAQPKNFTALYLFTFEYLFVVCFLVFVCGTHEYVAPTFVTNQIVISRLPLPHVLFSKYIFLRNGYMIIL
jgi:hypothetical protein